MKDNQGVIYGKNSTKKTIVRVKLKNRDTSTYIEKYKLGYIHGEKIQ